MMPGVISSKKDIYKIEKCRSNSRLTKLDFIHKDAEITYKQQANVKQYINKQIVTKPTVKISLWMCCQQIYQKHIF